MDFEEFMFEYQGPLFFISLCLAPFLGVIVWRLMQ